MWSSEEDTQWGTVFHGTLSFLLSWQGVLFTNLNVSRSTQNDSDSPVRGVKGQRDLGSQESRSYLEILLPELVGKA